VPPGAPSILVCNLVFGSDFYFQFSFLFFSMHDPPCSKRRLEFFLVSLMSKLLFLWSVCRPPSDVFIFSQLFPVTWSFIAELRLAHLFVGASGLCLFFFCRLLLPGGFWLSYFCLLEPRIAASSLPLVFLSLAKSAGTGFSFFLSDSAVMIYPLVFLYPT